MVKINRQNLKWVLRIALIVALVAGADALVVLFVSRPFPWTVFIPASLPILMSIFVIIPSVKAEKS